MRNVILTITAVAICFNIIAQDLIQDTQNNVTPNVEEVDSNLIYQYIEETFSNSTYSKAAPFVLNRQTEHHLEQYEEIVSNAIFLNSRLRVINQLHSSKPKNLKLSIPLGRGRNIELLLSKKDITIPDFNVTTSSESDFNLTREGGLFYHGAVEDHPGSIAAVSVFQNDIRVLISDKNGNYVLAAVLNEEETKKQSNNLLVFYNDKNLLDERAFNCGTRAVPQSEQLDLCDDLNVYPLVVPVNHYIEIFIECEFNAFNLLYNNSEFYTYYNIASIFNEASLVYALENIDIKLSEVHIINDENDQIAALENLIMPGMAQSYMVNWGSITDEFANYKQNNYNGRLACLFAYPVGYNAENQNVEHLPGGTAHWGNFNCSNDENIPLLCMSYYGYQNSNSSYGPYSVLAPDNDISNFPVYSYDVLAFAHEIGHNFGSPHTHNCVWGPNNDLALDNCKPVETTVNNCTGLPTLGEIPTIMSYCDTPPPPLINGFGQEPGDLIRSNYALGCGTPGTLDCHGDVDIFTSDPWLLDFVDPNDCYYSQITVWLFAGILPVFYIQNPFGGTMFVNFGGSVIELCDDGITPGYCLDLIKLEDVVANWTCRCCNGAIDAANFENGWTNTIWQDGGNDCRIVSSSAYALSVPNSVELRDNSGSNSSMVTESMQLQSWDQIEVSFSFIGVGMDYFDDFYLELSTDGGVNYTTIERWIADNSQSQSQFQLPTSVKWFTNNVRYTESITIPAYALSNDTKLRFRCDATNNWDRVYIDNVVIRGCPYGTPKTSNETQPSSKIDKSIAISSHFTLYPNPVQNTLNLSPPNEVLSDQGNFELSIFSLKGERVIYKKMNTEKSLQIDVSQLDNNQIYLLHFKTSDQKIYSAKFMKK